MKVLFIYPEVSSAPGFSAGVGALSAILKQAGHQTKLLHISPELGYPLELDRIKNDISRIRPGLICFSATTNQWYFTKIIGQAIKEKFRIPIIVGGASPNSCSG